MDFQGPGPEWSPEIIELERKIRREGEPMEVERIKQGEHVFYRVSSQYAGWDTLAFEPKELLKLLTYLQENEAQIVQDSLDNDVRAGMREIERDEQ